MNLNPRRISRAEAHKYDAGLKAVGMGEWRISDTAVDPRTEPSIWAMELPNESYAAPQAAFWWVSNEGRALLRLPGAGRA